MASITNEPNGRRTIQFVASDGKRKSIRLGKVSKKIAKGIKRYVEELNTANIANHPIGRDTAQWLSETDEKLYCKLVAVGLVAERVSASQSRLGDFLDAYISGRSDVTDGTKMVYRHTKSLLIDYFGPKILLSEITAGDADDWRRHLLLKGLAENTVRRRSGIARQFFKYAVRKRMLPDSPFAEIEGGVTVRANRERDYFVKPLEAEKVLRACPDIQWQLLFALSRYGGLRCPSEHLRLTWGDVDWENAKLTVNSKKTKRYSGKECRVVPIFPELRPYLQAVYDQLLADFDAKKERLSQQPIITRYRSTNSNLRTQLERIIKKAGLKPWPKLFQNLRSTRETELAEVFPIHVVCEWIGNSQAVATKHYLQVTEDHFALATNPANKALQKPVQQVPATTGNALKAEEGIQHETAELRHYAEIELARLDSNQE